MPLPNLSASEGNVFDKLFSLLGSIIPGWRFDAIETPMGKWLRELYDRSLGSYTPSTPGNYTPPLPTNATIADALDQLAERLVAVESALPSYPAWTFVGGAPLLGEGFYISGTHQATRAFANSIFGDVAADADGVYDGVSGRLMVDSGVECSMRVEPGLTGLDAPAPGKLLYTSWTTAGLFTTVEPASGSGNFSAVRGKIVDASAYNPVTGTGSPVKAIFRPTVEVGPV